jgi:ribosome-associated protein
MQVVGKIGLCLREPLNSDCYIVDCNRRLLYSIGVVIPATPIFFEVKRTLAKKKTTIKKIAVKKTAAKKAAVKKAAPDSKDFAIEAAKIASSLHCTDIVILDLKGVSPATDYFVIATGTSDRQMRTVADDVCEAGHKIGFKRFGRAGYEQGKWILIDFVDVVVHIFDREYRKLYDLELLWGDAKQVKW